MRHSAPTCATEPTATYDQGTKRAYVGPDGPAADDRSARQLLLPSDELVTEYATMALGDGPREH
ncbi:MULTISPECIES: hypothetical protein [unclassified Streptomyces]|uniref:hypothetical protein n=1 Tax=unclassified Streptomyces TaxID=2593676 RepID=UPI00380A3977